MIAKYIDIIGWVVLGIVGIALCSAAYSWYSSRPVMNTEQYTTLPPVKETIKIKRIKVPGPKEIVTVEKKVVVEKLKLPEELKSDPNKQILATGEVPPYEGKTNVVAVMDTKAGSTQIIAKQQPLPIVAFENKKEIGVRGGYAIDKEGSAVRGDVYGRWTFFRIGKIHTGVYGEINTKSEGKTMIDVSYRW